MKVIKSQEIKPECAEDCVLFDSCSAPLCPVEKDGLWYSDEDICNNGWFQKNRIVVNQKKLRRNKAEGLFTTEKLKSMHRISKSTKGEKVK